MMDTCVSAEAAPRTPVNGKPSTPRKPRTREAILASAEKAKLRQNVDLAAIPWNCPFAMLNEYQAAAILGMGVKAVRRRRAEGGGPRFTKINGYAIRYKMGDLQAWLASQPTGGGALPATSERRRPGRPRKEAA